MVKPTTRLTNNPTMDALLLLIIAQVERNTDDDSGIGSEQAAQHVIRVISEEVSEYYREIDQQATADLFSGLY